MPQMAPMSWMMLFLFFTSSMIIMATMNYYIYTPMMKEKKSKMSYQQKLMNWK
uniref:ATP synthase complex subunit 8 n=1 Tax=Argia sedula TaxID=218365 RepID=Q85SD4_9ODON|nr:ATP synthase F0 subunit 8 [Argia sedula]